MPITIIAVKGAISKTISMVCDIATLTIGMASTQEHQRLTLSAKEIGIPTRRSAIAGFAVAGVSVVGTTR